MRDLSPCEIEFLAQWQAFLGQEIAPQAEALENTAGLPWAALRALGRLGFFGMAVPCSRGGLGLSKKILPAALELLANISPTLALVASIPLVTTHIVDEFGQSEWIDALLIRLCRGEAFCAFAYTETGGSPNGNFTTQAVFEGEQVRLDGSKTMISWGGEADYYMTAATLRLDEKTHRPLTLIVSRETAGVSFGPMVDKMAFPALVLRDVHLSAVRLEKGAILGRPGFGLKIAHEAILLGRLCMTTVALGLSQTVFEESLDHALAPRAQGRKLADLQSIQFTLAEMKLKLEACRGLVRDAWQRYTGDDPEKALSIAMAKIEGARTVMDLCDRGLQLQGGAGYLQGNRMERRFRQARIFSLVEGTSEIQLVTIANRLLSGRV